MGPISSRVKSFVATAALVAVAAIPAQQARAAASMTPINISFSTWTGYGPLVVGVRDGIFKKYGLDVKYSLIESPSLRRDALRTGRIDGAASTVDTFARWAGQGAAPVQVLGIDRSEGGDGIVSKKTITSVKQLKGQTVAVNVGSTSEWFMYYVLRANGLSVSDINVLDMPDSSVAGSTFRAGKVGVAVTWQPWLDRAEQAPFGHVLVSSKTYPNIIVDDFAFSASFIKAHPAAISKFVQAYFAAVNLVLTNPKQTYPIIGKFTGETVAGVTSDFTGVKLMDLPQSKAYFGTPSKHGPIYGIETQAANFWLSLHDMRGMPNINQSINSSFQSMM
ncbi:MAG TPA: ABC transporter substrate-binding protein [Chloroflexota bacterium]